MTDQLKISPKVVGVKQTRKAVLSREVKAVFIARDAESRVIQPVISACQQLDLSVTWVETMAELGHACGIEVGASVAALLK